MKEMKTSKYVMENVAKCGCANFCTCDDFEHCGTEKCVLGSRVIYLTVASIYALGLNLV